MYTFVYSPIEGSCRASHTSHVLFVPTEGHSLVLLLTGREESWKMAKTCQDHKVAPVQTADESQSIGGNYVSTMAYVNGSIMN